MQLDQGQAHTVDEFGDVGVGRDPLDQTVVSLVVLGEAGDVAVGLGPVHLGLERLERRAVRLGRSGLGGETGGQPFEHLARAAHLEHRGAQGAADQHAPVRDALEVALAGEDAERLAHAAASEAVFLGQIHLDQPLTQIVAAAEDTRPDVLRDRLRRGRRLCRPARDRSASRPPALAVF